MGQNAITPPEFSRDQLIEGINTLTVMLLDDGKQFLSKDQNWRLDEYLDGYLTDEEFKEYAEGE